MGKAERVRWIAVDRQSSGRHARRLPVRKMGYDVDGTPCRLDSLAVELEAV